MKGEIEMAQPISDVEYIQELLNDLDLDPCDKIADLIEALADEDDEQED
jgi:hypothetical protein